MEGSLKENIGLLKGWTGDEIVDIARDVLTTEAEGISHLLDHLDGRFALAVAWLYATEGRVIVMGIGKSGLIGRKIAATLSSTGTPALFVHPVEAMHGDLGAIRSKDLILALSNSGETDELNAILPALKRLGTHIIALSGNNTTSTLARLSDLCLYTGVPKEACPLGLAPTASTTAMLAMGDALAVALIKLHGFKVPDFRRTHPGGQLGARLQVPLWDIMRHGEDIPRVRGEASLQEALEEMSRKELGATLVVDEGGTLRGIFTDGDLRRALSHHIEISNLCVHEIMTPCPRSIEADQSVAEAIEMMERHLITILPVADSEGRLQGVLNLHDLLGKGKIRFTSLNPREL